MGQGRTNFYKPWALGKCHSGIALFEYLPQVPANRIGYNELNLGQLKIVQVAITRCVSVPFALFYMRESLKRNHLWAGLCIVGAVSFIFRD